jgi:competence protein ComEC
LLKASHHGSKTSNSLEFLNVVNPKYILISVKQNNIYGFPNNEFLLARDNVYRTDINDSVTFYKRKKSLFIRK